MAPAMQPVRGTRRTGRVVLVRIACSGKDTDPDADTDTDARRTCWTPDAERGRSGSGIAVATARGARSDASKAARPSVLPGRALGGAPRRHAMQSTAS